MGTVKEYFAIQRVPTERQPRAGQQIIDTGKGIQEETTARVADYISGKAGQVARQEAIKEARKQEIRDNLILASMKGQLDEYEFNASPNIEKIKTIQDFQRQEDRYNKSWDQKVEKLIRGQSEAVSSAFRTYAEEHRKEAKQSYRAKSFAAEKDWALADLQKQWATRLKGNLGNPEEARKSLEKLVNAYSGYLTPSQKQSRLANIDKSVAMFEKLVQLDELHERAKVMPYQEAIMMLNDVKGVTSAERNDLIARRKRQDEIENSTESEGNSVYWNMLRKVTRDPDSVTEAMLDELVMPGGITVKQWKELNDILEDEDDPLKSPRAQLYFQSLDELYDKRLTDDEQRMNYDIANEKLMNAFRQKPDMSATEAAQVYNDILQPEISRWLKFGRFTSYFQPFHPMGRALRKATAPVKPEDSYRNKSDSELEGILNR